VHQRSTTLLLVSGADGSCLQRRTGPAASFWGTSVASLGDWDEDGIDDYAIGDSSYQGNSGRVWFESGAGLALSTPYCFGSECPCQENEQLSGCKNSTGGGAALAIGAGGTSLAADNLILKATGLPKFELAALVIGVQTASFPFGNGLSCISTRSMQIYPHTQANIVGETTFGLDLVQDAFLHFQPWRTITAGQTWHFQTWYRDPKGTCSAGHSMTNALAISFEP
jgi:hypothetical protein